MLPLLVWLMKTTVLPDGDNHTRDSFASWCPACIGV
jgi:hypothetical protein